jgi:hypothetical protein
MSMVPRWKELAAEEPLTTMADNFRHSLLEPIL